MAELPDHRSRGCRTREKHEHKTGAGDADSRLEACGCGGNVANTINVPSSATVTEWSDSSEITMGRPVAVAAT